MSDLTQCNAWRALTDHYFEIAEQHMRAAFAQDPHRFERFSLRFEDILLDYSKNRIVPETLGLLLDLARRNGSAVAIGHPQPATLALLARELPRLSSRHGAKLVPVARLVQRQQERDSLWRASWSP